MGKNYFFNLLISIILFFNFSSCTRFNNNILNILHIRAKITKISSRYNKISVILSKDSPNKYYRLHYGLKKHSTWIKPQKNTVEFPVDLYFINKDSCLKFQVKDKKSNIRWVSPYGEFYRSDFCYKSNTFYSYKQNLSKKQNYEIDLSEKNKKLDEINQVITHSSNSLSNNNSYKDGSCILLPTKRIPRRPWVICDDEDLYTKKQLLCLVPLGSEACGAIAKKLVEERSNRELYNFISAPACSKMLYELAKEEYPPGSAVLDSLIGAADDIAGKAFESGGLFGWLTGLAIRGGTTVVKTHQIASCFDQLERSCKEPIDKWKKKVAEIKNKPYLLRERCEYHVDKLTSYAKRKNNLKHNIKLLKNNIVEISDNLKLLSSKRDIKRYQ